MTKRLRWTELNWRSPGEGNGYPLHYSCWRVPWTRSLGCYSPWGCKESDTTEQLHFHAGFELHGAGSSAHRLFDMNLIIREGNREIKKFFIILLTFFSYNLASTITLNFCLHLVYLRPILSSVHINQCCSQMMTKDSQFSCLTAYSTPIAFREL